MRKFAYFLFVSAFVLSLSCAEKEMKPTGNPYVLSMKYKPGRSYEYLSNMNINNTMQMGGMSPTTNILSDVKYSITLLREAGDTLFLKVKIEDISTKIKTPAGFKEINETDVLKGKEVNFAILKDGTVVKGINDNTQYANELKNIVKGISRMFGFLPGYPVRVNETWVDSTEDGVARYTLKKVKIEDSDTIAIIKTHFKVNMTKEEERNGMKIKSTLKGDGDGTMKFSIKRGILLDVTSTMGLEGTAHMEGGMAGGGMDMPMYIDQTSETKFLKEE